MLAHRSITPALNFASTYLYTWVERGTVKCLAQEHTQCPQPGFKLVLLNLETSTNHEATAPSHILPKNLRKWTQWPLSLL